MTTGEKSQFPLTRLASKYIEMQKDGRLLSVRSSIGIVRSRIEDLAKRIDLNEAPDRLENIHKLWNAYKLSLSEHERAESAKELDEEFEKAYHDYASWKQIFDAIDIDRKLVESEVKVIKDIHAVLTVEDAYELTAQLLSAIITTINSENTIPDHTKVIILKRMQYEFTRIVGDKFSTGSGGSGPETDDAIGGVVD